MGVTCTLYRVTGAEVEQIIENPDRLDRLLEKVEGPSLPLRIVRPKGLLGLILRIFPITITEVVPSADDAPLAKPPDPGRALDIDTAWHGLHYLIAGRTDRGEEPASYFVNGGEALDDDGYARALPPTQVRRFAEFLSSLTRDQIQARMTELENHPEIWSHPASREDDPRKALLDYFADVKEFVGKAAVTGDGVIVHIS